MELNFWAIIIAAIANIIIGSFWYSPLMFGSLWFRLMGEKEESSAERRKKIIRAFILSFFAALVMAYVLALAVAFVGITNVYSAVTVAFWIWIGFVAASGIGAVLYERKRIELYIINVIYYLVAMIAMAIIITLWP